MSGKVAGSPRSFTFGGPTYDVKADANANRQPEESIEYMRHTGGVTAQVTQEAAGLEAVSLDLSVAEYEQLKAAAAGGAFLPASFGYADGTVLRADASVMLGPHESQTNKCDITVTPSGGSWEAFLP